MAVLQVSIQSCSTIVEREECFSLKLHFQHDWCGNDLYHLIIILHELLTFSVSMHFAVPTILLKHYYYLKQEFRGYQYAIESVLTACSVRDSKHLVQYRGKGCFGIGGKIRYGYFPNVLYRLFLPML